MASLYEIDERLQALENYLVDSETGEIIETEEEFNKLFDEIQMDLASKIESTMCFYKNLQSDISAFKEEEKKLAQRRKVKENLAERLKKRIDDYITFQYTDEEGNVNLEQLNKYKFETPKVKLSYRKSETVNVLDIGKLPKKFIKEKVEISADKTLIKKCIKDGKLVDGAELVTNVNMQVK